MSALCITCGERPRKKGRRLCGPCAYRSEDQEKARLRRQRGRAQRREYKRAQRRAAGCELMEVKRARAAQRRAEAEAKRAERLAANSLELKPWLAYPGGAVRYRWRYQNDPEFAQRERERVLVFRYTHPDIAANSDSGNRWRLAAARADGSVTEDVVRKLLHTKRCYLCGTELTPANRSIDHRVALIVGGNHSAGNLAACCMPCNREKARRERRQAKEDRNCLHLGTLGQSNSRVPATPGFRDVGER